MKIIITGGTGLIGTALTRSLLDNDFDITIISRSPDQVGHRVKALPWDLDLITQEINSANAVINLAGASISGSNPLTMRWTKSRKSAILSSRVQAGNLIQQAMQLSDHKPELLIQASAIGFYGNSGNQPADEKSPPGDDFLADICQAWEKSTAGVEELGVRRIITRLGLVLSREGGLLPVLSLPFKFFLGGPIGSGQQPMSWIHIEDVIRAFLFFINEPNTQGTYNLTAPTPVINRNFAKELGSTIKRPSWFPLPSPIMRIALGEAATLALDGREVLPRRLLESGFDFHYNTLNSALNGIYH